MKIVSIEIYPNNINGEGYSVVNAVVTGKELNENQEAERILELTGADVICF